MQRAPLIRWIELIFFAGMALMAGASMAQSRYPDRPIKLVVPYPPGALTDLLARAIGERLGASLKQSVIVDNKPGAGTLVGAEYVAKQPADGYTLLMATSTTLGISPALYQPSPINPVKDFVPISQVGTVNFFLIANLNFPAKNVREMIDAIKKNPGKYNYASVGNGSPHQLFMEALKTEYGLDIQHVPYKGTPAALTDLLAGSIQVMFADATIAVPNIQAGKVTALGTSAAKQTTLAAIRAADRNDRRRLRLAGVAGHRRAGGNAEGYRGEIVRRVAENPGHARIQGTVVQVWHGTHRAAHSRAVLCDHRKRTAALGEGHQRFRRKGRLIRCEERTRGKYSRRRPHPLSHGGVVPIAAGATARRAIRSNRSAAACAPSISTGRHS